MHFNYREKTVFILFLSSMLYLLSFDLFCVLVGLTYYPSSFFTFRNMEVVYFYFIYLLFWGGRGGGVTL